MSSKDSIECQPGDEKTVRRKNVWISSFEEITDAYYYLSESTVWDDRHIMESHNCLMWLFIIILCGFFIMSCSPFIMLCGFSIMSCSHFITFCGSPLCLVMQSWRDVFLSWRCVMTSLCGVVLSWCIEVVTFFFVLLSWRDVVTWYFVIWSDLCDFAIPSSRAQSYSL